MARHIPFRVAGKCIDCGARACMDQWRCRSCDSALSLLRIRVRGVLVRAIKRGDLPSAKESICVDCEGPAFDYDHRDYSRPLDVTPVCRKCNQRRGPAYWRIAERDQREAA
jgi:hypothetical protein